MENGTVNMVSHSRKKLLLLAARLPLPLDTGARIRSYNILKGLSSVHEVTCLSFCSSLDDNRYAEMLRGLGIKVCTIINPRIDRAIKVFDLLANIGSPLPVNVQKYYNSAMERAVAEKIGHFDAVHCEHLHMAQYLTHTKRIPKVLNAHNVETVIARRLYETERNLPRKLVYFLNYLKMKRFETAVVKSFDMALTVSSQDSDEFRRMGAAARLEVAENGVDTNYFTPGDTAPDGSLVFVGSMDWLPNDDGMLNFLEETYPALLAKGRKPQLYIVGRNPSARLIAKANEFDTVTVTGTVDDVRPYIDRASVSVVPLRFGGGTRLKILEAFSMGKAVVSTALGCEGIACEHDENILIADSAADFVTSIEHLLDDATLRQRLGNKAQSLVQQNYSWVMISEKVTTAYMGLLAPKAIGSDCYV